MSHNRRTFLAKLFSLPVAFAAMSRTAFAKLAMVGFSDETEESRYKSLGRNVLRFINTAQAWHNIGVGSGQYAELGELAQSETMSRLRDKLANHPQLGTSFQDNLRILEKEIVPGWQLEFRLSPERSEYLAVLRDVSGKTSGCLSTDQRGVIYEGAPLDSLLLASHSSSPLNTLNSVPLQVATIETNTSLTVRIRELLRNIASVPDFVCPCRVSCGGENICCYPCCLTCTSTCDVSSGCSCCVNVGCLSCVWCCG
jgi:hypothetical protein